MNKLECLPPCKLECLPPSELECLPPSKLKCLPPCKIECLPPSKLDCLPPCKLECLFSCKLECLPLENIYKLIVSQLDRRYLKLRSYSCLTPKLLTSLKRFLVDKHTSLFCPNATITNDAENKLRCLSLESLLFESKYSKYFDRLFQKIVGPTT
jgi:hypothetical protein